MNVKIIPATAADAEELVSIQQQAFKRLYDIYHDEGNPYLRGTDEIIAWLERPNWRVYKIYADSALCGGFSFCERNGMPGVYYLARIYILPELQGNGIASTAVLLCEKTIANANLWTLDFPVNEIMNRKCYEKAGYVDTEDRREQSGGAITLAYMEKKIPAFRDMKNYMDNSIIQKILSYCVFDSSPEGIANKIADYHNHSSWSFYGWVENGEILGICGFEVHPDYVEILNISVAEDKRNCSIGKSMIRALLENYGLSIEAETDDDAVDFYRKTGFKITSFQKYGVTRYNCALKVPITLLYGTGNAGKLNAMRKHLSGLNINVIGLNGIDIKMPDIDESGNNPLENAKIKAMAYYKATGMPVFSCDSGLYIKNAPDELQPGVHVRNVNGKYLNDEEMIEYYSSFAEKFGGQMTVRYKNGICLV